MIACGETYSVVKKTQQSIENSDVLINVTDLALSYVPQTARPFQFRFFVPFQTDGALSGFKFNIDCGAPTLYSALWRVLDSTTNSILQQVDIAAPAVFSMAFTNFLTCLEVEGIIENGSGLLQLQFAQQVSDGDPLLIFPPSSATGFYV